MGSGWSVVGGGVFFFGAVEGRRRIKRRIG
jgi:hypothetical protein